MNRITFKIITLFLLILVSCIVTLGCDGALDVIGTTYEWIDAPAGATSKIYIEDVSLGRDVEPTLREMTENLATDISIVPLGGVKIEIGSKSSIERRGEGLYLWETLSDSSGNVDDFWTIAAGENQFLIRASKSGYMEVVGETEYGDAINHVIIVILVKDNN